MVKVRGGVSKRLKSTLEMIVASSTAKSATFRVGPSLKHFILRQQVLDLYKSAIRATRCTEKPLILELEIRIHLSPLKALPRHARSETIAWVRHEFERSRHLEDTVSSCNVSDSGTCSNTWTTGEDQRKIDSMRERTPSDSPCAAPAMKAG